MSVEGLKQRLHRSPYYYDIFGANEPGNYAATRDLTELRKEPTLVPLGEDEGRDENILCTVSAGEAVRILKRKDEWVYLFCPYYQGWTQKENVHAITREQALSFSRGRFAVVTEPFVTVKGITFDMGARLSIAGEIGDEYVVWMPDGCLLFPKDKAHEGYIPYRKATMLRHMRKWIGTPYKWGNADKGVDCSGLIHRVFRCFGVDFPRDVIGQKCIPDAPYISLEESTEMLETMLSPALLFTEKHVMMMTRSGKKAMILHAPRTGETVVEERLSEEMKKKLKLALPIC